MEHSEWTGKIGYNFKKKKPFTSKSEGLRGDAIVSVSALDLMQSAHYIGGCCRERSVLG